MNEHAIRKPTLTPVFALMFACALIAAPALATEKGGEAPVAEYCGQGSVVAPPRSFVRWDCSQIQAASMSALEDSIRASEGVQTLPNDGNTRRYESKQPIYTIWLFDEGRGIRYRTFYEGAEWRGIGVTSFCTGRADICAHLAGVDAYTIPFFLIPQLGPPAPEAPSIER